VPAVCIPRKRISIHFKHRFTQAIRIHHGLKGKNAAITARATMRAWAKLGPVEVINPWNLFADERSAHLKDTG